MFSGARGSGMVVGVETRALVGDADNESVGIGLEGCGDVLFRVVGVAVEDGVDGRLADCHGNVGDGIFVESGAGGEVFGGSLYLVHAIERGTQRERDAACGGIGQMRPFRLR